MTKCWKTRETPSHANSVKLKIIDRLMSSSMFFFIFIFLMSYMSTLRDWIKYKISVISKSLFSFPYISVTTLTFMLVQIFVSLISIFVAASIVLFWKLSTQTMHIHWHTANLIPNQNIFTETVYQFNIRRYRSSSNFIPSILL